MKNLEKLENLKLENKKLSEIFGGKLPGGGDVTATAGGQTTIQDWPTTGWCTTTEYTSDTRVSNGEYIYHGEKVISQAPN
ncbi:hypothetical protein AB670_01016 [Chryseobacterium sp. MOF25P]|uniref:hypothetical protein n=1 Tax=unclassified Chryseobacterium TaxID=2593645 RepID=UPI0008054B87|nr:MULTISPECIES: hypothetical protein [unclassified Chryseobacterium]OBW42606.1 hypothetical protein AB670_01016 [Chryseobacterium sp. MOF25P]OBW44856.1 hypothetical protein AB671_03052 [Chryseobacterium sp. BGARF1]